MLENSSYVPAVKKLTNIDLGNIENRLADMMTTVDISVWSTVASEREKYSETAGKDLPMDCSVDDQNVGSGKSILFNGAFCYRGLFRRRNGDQANSKSLHCFGHQSHASDYFVRIIFEFFTENVGLTNVGE